MIIIVVMTTGRNVSSGLGRLDRCLSSPTRHARLDDDDDDVEEDDEDDDDVDDDVQ